MSEMRVSETLPGAPGTDVPGSVDGSATAPSDPWDEFLGENEADDFNPEPPPFDDDEIGAVAPSETSQQGSGTVEVPPPTSGVQPAPEASPPPQDAVVTPPVSGEQIPPVVAAPTDQPPVPAAPATDLSALRSAWEADLVKQYAIPEEDATKFITDTGTMLPALAAKLHVSIFDQVLQTVVGMFQQQLPTLVDQVQTSKKTATEAEEAFFSEWEELRPHRAKVMEIATAYRQLNPKASAEEFRKAVGMQAWMLLGRSPAELVVKLNGGQVPPSVRSAPATPGRVIPLPPVQPAGSASAELGRQSSGPVNPYVEMANSWLEEID